jgi:hypothetical protein
LQKGQSSDSLHPEATFIDSDEDETEEVAGGEEPKEERKK